MKEIKLFSEIINKIKKLLIKLLLNINKIIIKY